MIGLRTIVAAVAALLAAESAAAAEIKVLSTNAVTDSMADLGPAFERSSGHKLSIAFTAANLHKQAIDGGAAFDVAILTQALTEELAKSGKVLAESQALIARSGVGLLARAGAPKPDISTAEAFKRTMQAAQSVAYTTEGTSGRYFLTVLERLGIAEEMKPKARTIPSGRTAALVARGEAQYSVQQVSELLSTPGTELVGPFPPELQRYTVFSAGVGHASGDPTAARALIAYLTAPAAVAVFQAKGMLSPR